MQAEPADGVGEAEDQELVGSLVSNKLLAGCYDPGIWLSQERTSELMMPWSRISCVLSRHAALWLIAPLAFGQYQIVFDGSRANSDNEDVFVISQDGTQLRRLTHTAGRSQDPQWPGRASRFASWSADGTQIVFASNMDDGGKPDIYVMRSDGREVERLTREPDEHYSLPVWSPDGSRVAFTHWDSDTEIDAIMTMGSDGTDIRRLTPETVSAYYPSWSPDGREIAFTGRRIDENDNSTHIYLIEIDGSNLRRLTGDTGDQAPDWSPDGKWIAFDTTRDGNFEIYVMKADGSNQRRLTNHFNVDSRPSWSPDGKQIVFNSSRHVPHKTEENIAGYRTYEIYVMDSDGSNVRRLTFNDTFDGHPDW